MKVLLINDYYEYGGAEIQTLREKKILESHGHNVKLITFDEKFDCANIEDNIVNYPLVYSFWRRNLNRFGFKQINEKLQEYLNNEINLFSPDIIHLNNVNKEPFTIYKIVNNFKSVQTLRDYSSVCPKGTCIKDNFKICTGFMFNDCRKECITNPRQRLQFLLWKRINRTRKKNIANFIAPSSKLTKYCNNNGLKTKCVNNSFDFEYTMNYEKKTDFNKKKYLYFGTINYNKGVLRLIKAFKRFSTDKDVELVIAGNVVEDIKDDFFDLIENDSKIKYLGILKYQKIIKLLSVIHTIVVPSIWMENYPNTVLEGLALKVFVIGSNRGGIPEMLNENRGFLFDVDNIDDIVNKLKASYNLSKTEYKRMVENNFDYVKKNNSMEKYYFRIINLFQEIIEC